MERGHRGSCFSLSADLKEYDPTRLSQDGTLLSLNPPARAAAERCFRYSAAAQRARLPWRYEPCFKEHTLNEFFCA